MIGLWENEVNRWKINDNFDIEWNQFLKRLKKNRTKWVGLERWTDEMKNAEKVFSWRD